MKRIVFQALLSCVALGARASGEATLSADGTVLTLEVASGDVWTNSSPVPGSVTAIVKNGGGEACFVPLTNTTFTGSIAVNAGFLSGFQNSFGRPASLTVADGAAILFLDLYPASLGAGSSPFNDTEVTVSGSGPDGYGAIQRPVTAVSGLANGLFRHVTLAGDATINCGSRWGFGNTDLDMDGHTLTLSGAKRSHNGGPTASSADTAIFQLALGGNVRVKNPGAIVATGGARLRIAGGSRLQDATDSSGSVADMVVTLENGTRFQFDGVTVASAFTIAAKATSSIEVLGNKDSLFDGVIDAQGECQFIGSGNLRIGGTGGIVGAAKIQRMHDVDARLTLEGSGTSNPCGEVSNNGFWSRSRGSMTVGGTARFAPHGLWVGHSGIDRPAVMRLAEDALFAPTNGDNTAQVYVGGRNRSEGHAGIVEVQDRAVYSNDCFVGFCGRGAVYVYGGTFAPQSRSGFDGQLYVGRYGYGYIGLDGGTLRHSLHLNLCGDDDSANNYRGRGFFVQRGGEAFHLGVGRYIRMCTYGDDAYAAYAQLGGSCLCSNNVAMGHRSYLPNGYGSTSVLTVSGTNTVMDMSYGRIQVIASTNVHLKPAVAMVNVNGGATLKVSRIYRTQMTDSTSPAWAALDPAQVAAASPAYINFNGGTIVASREGEFFFSSASDTSRELTRATVYEGGAAIDTAGNDVVWRMPLLRPCGLGIRSVTLPSELDGESKTNLLVSPARCTITDATGAGADVLMDFSNATRRVHRLIVTSPGFGYTAPSVVCEKQSAWDASWTCPSVETVDYDDASFAHGGFTKRGEGALTLASSNTWGGVTRIEGGTLALPHAQGYPGGGLEIASAAIVARQSSDAPILSAAAFALGAGGSVRITEADTVDWKALARPRVLVRSAEPIAAMPPCELVGSGGEPLAMPFVLFSLKEGGTKLAISYNRGTAIIFR